MNMKERLDFSCAIFNPHGQLIANAPHMPVHLGSMGESIRTVIERNGATMRRGDVFVLNDPYHGGTHLPDVTVVSPVFDDAGDKVNASSLGVPSRSNVQIYYTLMPIYVLKRTPYPGLYEII